MTTITPFNRTQLILTHTKLDNATADQVQSTPVLRRAPLNKAALLGGPLLQRVLESAPLVGDKKHIFVDTKVSMLMPGWVPSIPGWHTDGVPRGDSGNPAGKGVPNLDLQSELSAHGQSPRFHTMTLGTVDCPTRFDITPGRLLKVPTQSRDLYAAVSEQMFNTPKEQLQILEPKDTMWASWDWWQLHAAIPSRSTGWRLLVRITETDFVEPATTGLIRQQSQVYVPSETLGW